MQEAEMLLQQPVWVELLSHLDHVVKVLDTPLLLLSSSSSSTSSSSSSSSRLLPAGPS
jgi:hypothetical protein